jgi:hypothetical protein
MTGTFIRKPLFPHRASVLSRLMQFQLDPSRESHKSWLKKLQARAVYDFQFLWSQVKSWILYATLVEDTFRVDLANFVKDCSVQMDVEGLSTSLLLQETAMGEEYREGKIHSSIQVVRSVCQHQALDASALGRRSHSSL